jgi:Domain of unknown function (DUF4331)
VQARGPCQRYSRLSPASSQEGLPPPGNVVPVKANDGDAREDLVIQARFEGFEVVRDPRCASAAGGQFVTVRGPARPEHRGAETKELGKKAPQVTGCSNTILTGTGSAAGIRVFAALRDDPFVVDVGQLFRILGGDEQVFRQFTSPVLGPLDGRPVDASGRSGFDGFGGFNTSVLVVEVPKAMVQGKKDRSGTYLANKTTIGVWGTTSRQKNTHRSEKDDSKDSGPFVQIQRMGHQFVKSVFIPTAQRDRFNREVPEDDLADLGHFSVPDDAPGFSRFVPDALTTTDNDGTGNTIAGRAGLLTAIGVTAMPNGAPLLLGGALANADPNLIRHVLFPDVLRLNLALTPPADLAIGILGPPPAALGLQNGRRLGDDVVDILFRLSRELADVNFPAASGVPGSGPPRLGALNCTVLPDCPDRRVLVVLQGTDFIEADSTDVSNSGNDRPLLADFPFFATGHPFPGNPGTTGYPPNPTD